MTDQLCPQVLYKHEDWIKSAKMMAMKPSAGGVVMNLGGGVPLPMVHDVALLGLRLEEVGGCACGFQGACSNP